MPYIDSDALQRVVLFKGQPCEMFRVDVKQITSELSFKTTKRVNENKSKLLSSKIRIHAASVLFAD